MQIDSVIRYDVSQKTTLKKSLASGNAVIAIAASTHHMRELRDVTLQQFVILG